MKQITEIRLNFNRNDFEEIYFKDNQGNYFKDPTIKPLFRNLLMYVFVFLSCVVYSKIVDDYGIFLIASIGLLYFAYSYLERLAFIQKKKKEIISYLDKQEVYTLNKLVISENHFSIIQDKEETIEKWENFKSVKILDNYVSLMSKEHFLIPSKSMTTEEYKLFIKLVSEKAK